MPRQDYFAASLGNAVCTPLWEMDTGSDKWIAAGFWIQEILGWKLLKNAPHPVVSTGIKDSGSIFLDQRGRVEFPTGEVFRSIEDALLHINEEGGVR